VGGPTPPGWALLSPLLEADPASAESCRLAMEQILVASTTRTGNGWSPRSRSRRTLLADLSGHLRIIHEWVTAAAVTAVGQTGAAGHR